MPIGSTYFPKKSETRRAWHVVDATGQVAGRLATRIAMVLMGKHRPTYTPHTDTGEFVIIVNASKIKLTGKKLDGKRYWRHSGYQGSLRSKTASEMLGTKPEQVIYLAVRKMLPKTKLGRQMVKKLHVYPGADHPHAAQMPQLLSY